ncbi:MAG: disulfide bond formation protein B [Hyphomicrobiaceae bacterium]
MAVATRRLASTPAYQWGGFTLFVATATILAALASEHIGGYAPCPLCLMQRWAYYAGIPLLFLGLVLVSAGQRGLAATVFFVVALAFLANAGLAVFHAGVEWKFWPGPDTCAGNAMAPLTGSAGQGVLGGLNDVRVIRCDEAPFRVLGLSMAGWNAIVCLALMVGALKAAMAAAERDTL